MYWRQSLSKAVGHFDWDSFDWLDQRNGKGLLTILTLPLLNVVSIYLLKFSLVSLEYFVTSQCRDVILLLMLFLSIFYV
jgi:hypothetical protein